MIEELILLSKLNNEDLINFQNPKQRDIDIFHNYIRQGKNTLVNRTLYYLMTQRYDNKSYKKYIEADIQSSQEDIHYKAVLKLVSNSTPTKELTKKIKLSKKEQQLLELIKESKHIREELITYIYGADSDYLKSQASFKSLLYRLKKKTSLDVFVSSKGIYTLTR